MTSFVGVIAKKMVIGMSERFLKQSPTINDYFHSGRLLPPPKRRRRNDADRGVIARGSNQRVLLVVNSPRDPGLKREFPEPLRRRNRSVAGKP